ncbi:MAG: long-chain fatty acid--CoA ligase [Propionibacteriaceae bacterium]
MQSTMQDTPLNIGNILRYGSTFYGSSEVVTWTGDGARRTSYREIGTQAAQLANALRGLGIDGDQRVGTFEWNNNEHLVCYLAIPSMGAVMHTLNTRLPADQLIYIADHAEDKVVVVDNSLIPLLAKVLPEMKTVEHVIVVGEADTAPLEGAGKQLHSWAELLAAQPETFDWPEIDERQAAAMCYTSGTTGNPKGVVYSHRSAYLHSMSACQGNAAGCNQDDRVLPVVPMFHANAWGLAYAAVMCGASLIMPDRFLQGEPLAKLIAAEQVTVAGGVPSIFSSLLNYCQNNEHDLSSMRVVLCGGSAVPQSLLEGFDKLGMTIRQAWGMTETSPVASFGLPSAGTPAEERMAYRVTAGRLLAEVEGRVMGPDGDVLPNDGSAVGELEVRGPWVTASYYKDDDPAKFDDGWLRTGDVGTLSAKGFFTISDRSKDVIKSGGEWISSVDLENKLMAHPAVQEASVVGIPDDKWGERPLGAIVLREGQSVTTDELREHLAGTFAKWQLPDKWTFIDEVPKTSVGKFDKKVIRARYADGELELAGPAGS